MVSRLIDLIRSKRFVSLAQAARELGTTPEVVREIVSMLIRKGILKKTAPTKGCACRDCSSCKDCPVSNFSDGESFYVLDDNRNRD
ncbi:MAG: hypothetical protein GX421_01320 [Caldisericales bacterium]|nr:hypothetical protein [Caldisericales bacterium]